MLRWVSIEPVQTTWRLQELLSGFSPVISPLALNSAGNICDSFTLYFCRAYNLDSNATWKLPTSPNGPDVVKRTSCASETLGK